VKSFSILSICAYFNSDQNKQQPTMSLDNQLKRTLPFELDQKLDDKLFLQIFEAMPFNAALLCLDEPTYTVKAVTNEYLKLTGRIKEQVVGYGFLEPLNGNPQDKDLTEEKEVRASLTKVIETKTTDTLPVKAHDVRGEDGALIRKFWSATNSPVLNEQGEIVYLLQTATEIVNNTTKTASEESEGKFRLLANALPEVIWVADNNGNTEFFNKRWEEFCGVPYTQSNAADVAVQFLHPDDGPIVVAAFSEAIRTGQPFEVEQRNRSASGEYRWFLNRAMPYRNPGNGEVEKWFGIGVDIHERKIAQDALRESERNLSFAIDSAELGTWEVDPSTQTYSGNRRFKEWFGLPPEDGLPISLAVASISEKDRVRVVDAITTALKFESGGHYDVTYSVVSKITGAERIVRAKGKTTFTSDRIPMRFNGTMQDVTEQVMSRNRLEASEARFRNVIEEATVGTALFEGPRFQLTLVNDHMLKLWQRDRSIVGKELLDFMPELKNQPFPGFLKHVYEAGIMHSENDALVQIVRNGSMEQLYMDYSYKALRNIDGQVYAILVSAADVTERFFARRKLEESENRLRSLSQKLEDEVRARTSELTKSNEDLQQFAHVASHDLKEPVRKIRTFATRLNEESGDLLNHRSKVYIEKIQQSTERMVTMIDGVLAYSSLSSEASKNEMVNLNHVFDNIKNDLEVLISEKGVELSIGNLPTIEAAPVLIYQLFYNLINNSIKFSATDTRRRIQVKSEFFSGNGKEAVRVIVSDNGIGFDQKFAATIFNTFTRLNSKDKYEGTGLGLALCRKIVERHKGSIEAHGEKGKGATFVITLPIKQDAQTT
jgi:PAS domain S-box-containing protein